MTRLVSDNQPSFLVLPLLDQYFVSEDYEQQRKDLMKKHGIDLGDPNGIADGRKTKRLAPKEIEQIMGGEEGEGGIFTWREKNRKKVCPLSLLFRRFQLRHSCLLLLSWHTQCTTDFN